MVVPESSLNYGAWCEELPPNYPNRDYILEGVCNGFHIIDPDLITREVEMDNYTSVTCAQNIDKVSEQIRFELGHGHYKRCSAKPKIVSALGAIPKNDSRVRLIHDCSRPTGHAVNDFASPNSFKYQSLQDAIDHVTQGQSGFV